MKVLKEIGTGNEYVYVYYNPKDKENNAEWPCKIGKTKVHPITRIQQQQLKAAFPYEPEIGLIIKVNNCGIMEREIHKVLSNKKIKNEWFMSNLTIIENCFWNVKNNPENILSERDLGYLIRDRRKSLRLSQTQLAEQCGLRQATISNIENGDGNPSIDTILSIIEHLNLKISITPQ